MAIKKRKKIGLPPGVVIFTGQRKVEKIAIHYVQYNGDELLEQNFDNQSITSFHQSNPDYVQWYDVRGLHDTALIEEIGKTYAIHPLVLEDIASPSQRPKFEEYDNGNFITLRSLSFNKTERAVETEQITLFFGDAFLLSFQENDDDLFLLVRNRIQSGKGRIRNRGADYLAYALMDVIVDKYFLVMDEIQEIIEELEHNILNAPNENSKADIHHLKQEMIKIRKSIAPLREAIGRFSKSEHSLIDERTTIFLRDLFDNTVQIMDVVDSNRDILSGLQDLYISEISFKMNQVMQVLTIITTIFVPLSFLAGLYGMNFEVMPELKFKNGYFILLGVMLLISLGLLSYFKKKKWF
ncbi:MAG: magnesium/cobalt transporter CorA [Bacteroidota bacterium]